MKAEQQPSSPVEAGRQQNDPTRAVLDIVERQSRLQALRSAGISSEEYNREQREVNGRIEDLYKAERRKPRATLIFDQADNIITQPLHSFPSPFIIRELSPEEYQQFRSQVTNPREHTPIEQPAIERASAEHAHGGGERTSMQSQRTENMDKAREFTMSEVLSNNKQSGIDRGFIYYLEGQEWIHPRRELTGGKRGVQRRYFSQEDVGKITRIWEYHQHGMTPRRAYERIQQEDLQRDELKKAPQSQKEL